MNESITLNSIQIIDLNKTYEYKLLSGQTKNIIIHGNNNSNQLMISINGIENSYTDLNEALGEPYISFRKLD